MDRTEVFDLMGTLKLYGMRAAYDEVMAVGIKRRLEPARIVGDLLRAEIAEAGAVDQVPVDHRLPVRGRAASSCRWPRISMTSLLPARRSMRPWCAS